jgi:hypothetical protein
MAALLRSAAGMLYVGSNAESAAARCSALRWCDVCRGWVRAVPIDSEEHQTGSRHRRNCCVIEVHMAGIHLFRVIIDTLQRCAHTSHVREHVRTKAHRFCDVACSHHHERMIFSCSSVTDLCWAPAGVWPLRAERGAPDGR